MRIVAIDDDMETLDIISTCLKLDGFEVFTANRSSKGLQLALKRAPDLVILDVLLPEISGLELCRQLRALSDVPILAISGFARQTNDQISALDVGADDYLLKPFNCDLLKARVVALLRRSTKVTWRSEHPAYIDLYLMVDLNCKQVFIEGKPISLSALEFQLLEVLIRSLGQTVPISEIVEELWPGSDDDGVYQDYVHTYVRRLRKKIEPRTKQARYIMTEHGLGYRFTLRT